MISKGEISKLLKNYHQERASVTKIILALEENGRGVFYPQGQSYDSDRVQHQYNQSQQLERMLQQCEDERRYYKRTLSELKDMTDKLDALILCVHRLPGHLKEVVLDTMISEKDLKTYSDEINKSEETVRRYRIEALELLEYAMNRVKV